jgi:hypothetical protein
MNYYKKFIKYDNKCKALRQQSGGKKIEKSIKKRIYDFMEYDVDNLICDSNNVKNEEDFIKFLTFLWKESGSGTNKKIYRNNTDLKKEKTSIAKNNTKIYEWANLSIHKFLESILQAYSDHMDYNNGKIYESKNTWSRIAKIIEMGKYYE